MEFSKFDTGKLYEFYYNALVNDCIPFWLKNAVDYKHGGYLTCLDREGKVYNTDKSVWFQGRALWTFSKIYNEIEKRDEWLAAAKCGYEFLTKYCYDTDGRMFFQVTQDGRPIQKRRYYFSETFAVIGCAEYSKASGDTNALEQAKKTFDMILDLYENPWKSPAKYYPESLQMKSMAVPMILVSTAQCLRNIDTGNTEKYNKIIDKFLKDIFNDFMKPEYKALFEHVGLNGEKIDSPKGRCINPGHSIETAWFLINEGLYRNDQDIINKSLNILDWSMELGWDKEHGGLLYFVDIEGKPAEQLEWDMKLWWPHTEALHALLLAYHITGDEKYKDQYMMVHDYSFSHFPDKEFGEWYGYLHRDGSVSNTLKGSMWKGPFHLPRALFLNAMLAKKMMDKENQK